jgi:hypothetical protein
MTDTLFRTGYNYTPDHRTYGGEITSFDFDGHHTMASMAIKIAQSERHDKFCYQNTLNRGRKNKLEDK